MATKIQAVFERGVFRPTDPVTIAEGTTVELTVTTDGPTPSAGTLADALAEIAHLPLRSPRDGFSGSDHDKVLYPPKGKLP